MTYCYERVWCKKSCYRNLTRGKNGFGILQILKSKKDFLGFFWSFWDFSRFFRFFQIFGIFRDFLGFKIQKIRFSPLAFSALRFRCRNVTKMLEHFRWSFTKKTGLFLFCSSRRVHFCLHVECVQMCMIRIHSFAVLSLPFCWLRSWYGFANQTLYIDVVYRIGNNILPGGILLLFQIE
jgi:hypothetical protein